MDLYMHFRCGWNPGLGTRGTLVLDPELERTPYNIVTMCNSGEGPTKPSLYRAPAPHAHVFLHVHARQQYYTHCPSQLRMFAIIPIKQSIPDTVKNFKKIKAPGGERELDYGVGTCDDMCRNTPKNPHLSLCVHNSTVSLCFFRNFQIKTGFRSTTLLMGKIGDGDHYGTMSSGMPKSSTPLQQPKWRQHTKTEE